MAKAPHSPPSPPSQTSTAPKAPPSPSAAPRASLSTASSTTATFSVAVPKKEIIPRLIFNCLEKWGKTSLAAMIPGVHLILAPDETGYDTLLTMGLVPAVPVVKAEDWQHLLRTVDGLIESPGECQYLGIDAMGGVEFMCHDFICKTKYRGEWGESGFGAYKRGFDESVPEWRGLLARLDRLQAAGVGTIFLSHPKVRTQANPAGKDYDQYVGNVHPKTWDVTFQWADAGFFGAFESVADPESKSSFSRKAIGKDHRLLYTKRRDGWVAGNRYGIAKEVLHMPDDPSQMWPTVWNAIIGAKK